MIALTVLITLVDLIAWLLFGLYVVYMWLFCCCNMVALWLLCGFYVFTMWFLCGCYVIDMWLIGCYAIDMWLLCGCYVVIMWLLCGSYVVVNQLLCGCYHLYHINHLDHLEDTKEFDEFLGAEKLRRFSNICLNLVMKLGAAWQKREKFLIYRNPLDPITLRNFSSAFGFGIFLDRFLPKICPIFSPCSLSIFNLFFI